MKEIACFYQNKEWFEDGTTEYFLNLKNSGKKNYLLLTIMSSIGLCSYSFANNDDGKLQIEGNDHGTAKNDVLLGIFYINDNKVIYEQQT